ncbi:MULTISPECIES: Holliday junction branch migration protein RuvA [Acidithrix]|uniref:Holliday junction branch migration complex subunit RuvA n=1 Tax=Acidithrix ferrooxidans TaxID=1280514 RepID=A0A0D8HLU6_9ACTN|nr:MULTISPECIES: Holliday junction branch migration protein RuvA [Acidithrix]KJF18071.1 holliday junction ATP-dependent DNA helicase RuvA [Acidithrix ferrooxidans]CAG4930080.1 unnamed protein product [Acidithrix sp. C25]
MIALLRGKVRGKAGDRSIVVDVGGVGYLVSVSAELFVSVSVDKDVELYCVTVVREDAITIFGFGSMADRNLFEALINVRLIGPSMASMIVSTLRVDDLIEAIETKQTAMLTRVPGVGEKTASRILVELSSKVGLIRTAVGDDSIGNVRRLSISAGVRNEVEGALSALGFDSKEIRGALSRIDGDLDSEQALRFALKELTK